MLPETLLNVKIHDGQVIPRFLSKRDEPWVRVLMQELDGFVGRPGVELDEAMDERIVPLCRTLGTYPRVVRGVEHELSRAWTRKVVAAARPVEIRRVLFEKAATGCDREQAIAWAAKDLGIGVEDVLPGLFADRPGARQIVAPSDPPDPQRVIELYNLATVQSLLARSERVVAHVRSDTRSVVRFAKLKGLLCTYVVDDDGTTIELSGPLSLFRNTTKYGNALASFFPSLVATPGWWLGATCLLRPAPWELDEGAPELRRVRLTLDARAPIASTHALPSDADSAVERKLMRDVRRLQRGWSIERETAALRAGTSVFFPDFTLARGSDRVLVEIVGYYTPEYLETKLRKLREANVLRLIVCIDQDLACSDDEITADCVLRYRRRVDASALLDAAERLVV
jgi:predicted nuclease of restriction endonuclease-like RecB superfamily